MKGFVLALFGITICLNLKANDTTKTATVAPIIRKDIRVDLLNEIMTNANKKTFFKPQIKREQGFRLQVISTNDRTEAYRVKGDLLEKFPSEKVYFMFQSPFFKVKIGNFKTKEEALEFRDAFLGYMGKEVYVVRDMIEYLWDPSKEETMVVSN